MLYVLTNDAEDETDDDFNKQLQIAISKVPQHEMVVKMGDLKAEVRSEKYGYRKCYGQAWLRGEN